MIRGNHDYAVGFAIDDRCSPPNKAMAAETGAFIESVLNDGEKAYLERLPLSVGRQPGNSTSYFAMQCRPICFLDTKTLHVPFIREFDRQTLINPGSIGQIKTDPHQPALEQWSGSLPRLLQQSVNSNMNAYRGVLQRAAATSSQGGHAAQLRQKLAYCRISV